MIAVCYEGQQNEKQMSMLSQQLMQSYTKGLVMSALEGS